MIGDGIGRISGHEQVLEIRVEGLQPLCHFTPVHFGHDHVGEEQANLAGVCLGQAHGLIWCACAQHGVTQPVEDFFGEFQK